MQPASRFTSLTLLRPAVSIAEVFGLVGESRAGAELRARMRLSSLSVEILAIPEKLRDAFTQGGLSGILPAACIRDPGSSQIKIYFDDQAPLLLAATQIVHELTHALQSESKESLEAEWEAHTAHLRFVFEQFRKNEEVRAVLERKFATGSHLWTPVTRGELAQKYGTSVAA